MPNLFSPTLRNSRRRSNRWICVTPSATPTSSALVYIWCLPSWMLSLCKQRSASRKYGQVYASFALNVLYRIVDVKSQNTKNTNAKTTLAVKCKSDPHPYVLYALLFLHKEGYINLNTSNYNAMQTTRREPRRDGSTVLEPNFCSVSVGFLLLETD